jgi:hypothetical protein
MHLTWALLIAINAHSGGLRLGLWVYVALMVVATLALREHYLVDLIAAVPSTLAIQWLARGYKSHLPVFDAVSTRASAGPLERGESQL